MKKLLITLLAIASVCCFAACGAKQLQAQPAPDDFYYEINDQYTQITVEAEGDNLEFSIDGETWQDSGVFDIQLETKYTPSARYKKTDGKEVGKVVSKTICTKPDASKINAAPTPDVFGSITIDVGDNAGKYEFSVELSPYSTDLVWEVSKTEVNIRARLVKTEDVDFCDNISFNVTDIPENPDKDYMDRISVSHDVSKSSEVAESTDAIGLNIREGVYNCRSIKIFNDCVENNFAIRIAPNVEYVAVSADVKIVCEGYDDTAIKIIDNDLDKVNWKLLGVTQVNEWKNIVLPTGYMAFDVPACATGVPGTFAVYIDNIKDLSESEVEQ